MTSTLAPSPGAPGPSAPSGLSKGPGRLALAIAIGLWCAQALCTSLDLNDLHALFDASQSKDRTGPQLGALFLTGASSIFGNSAWTLRIPGLLAWIGTVLLAVDLARRLPIGGGQMLVPIASALSSLLLISSSNLDSHALAGLCLLGWTLAVVGHLNGEAVAMRLAIWTALGLHAHSAFAPVLVLLIIPTLLLFLCWGRGVVRGAGAIAIGIAAGLTASWPVLEEQFQSVLALSPDVLARALPIQLAQGVAHLFFMDVPSTGELARLPVIACIALAGFLSLRGFVLLFRTRATRPLALVLALTVLGAVVATTIGDLAHPFRAKWLGAVGGVVPLAALAVAGARFNPAAGRFARLAGPGLALVLGGMGWLSLRVALHPGHEDYAGATEWVLNHAGREDAVLAIEWQDPRYPHALGWKHYSADIEGSPDCLPTRIDHTDRFFLAPGTDLDEIPSVFVLARGIPPDSPVLHSLRIRYPHEDQIAFGRGILVHRFRRGESLPEGEDEN